METRVFDLGTIRLDDVALIVSDIVRVYERTLEYTNYIIEDECVRLVNEERRRMTRHKIAEAKSLSDALDDPNDRRYSMSAFDAARKLAEAHEWYGRCIELVTHFVHLDKAATIEHINSERARRKRMGWDD